MDAPHPYAALGQEPIRTIDRDELKAKLDRGDDTPDELYAALQPDDEVVVYCSQVDCLSSVAVYRDLVRRGYRNVRRYAGGLLDWEAAGSPLEGEAVEPR